MTQHYDEKPRQQLCLNPQCGATLFISGLMGSDTTIRGIDREIEWSRDAKGAFVTCPKCKAKHEALEMQTEPGHGTQWKITSLRK